MENNVSLVIFLAITVCLRGSVSSLSASKHPRYSRTRNSITGIAISSVIFYDYYFYPTFSPHFMILNNLLVFFNFVGIPDEQVMNCTHEFIIDPKKVWKTTHNGYQAKIKRK